MSQPIRLKTPLSDEDVEKLKIGDRVLIQGVIYTGRDAAHKRLIDLLKEGKSGKYVRWCGIRIIRDFNKLIFEQAKSVQKSPKFNLTLPVPGEVKLAHTNSVFRATFNVGALSTQILNRWELFLTEEELRTGLQIRNWQPGDSYLPQGTSSPKKLKELFTRGKIPKDLRLSWPVVTLSDQIVFAKDFPVSVDMIRRQVDGLYKAVIVEERMVET